MLLYWVSSSVTSTGLSTLQWQRCINDTELLLIRSWLLNRVMLALSNRVDTVQMLQLQVRITGSFIFSPLPALESGQSEQLTQLLPRLSVFLGARQKVRLDILYIKLGISLKKAVRCAWGEGAQRQRGRGRLDSTLQ